MAVQLLEDWLLKEQEKIITTYRELNQAPLKEPGLIFIGDSIVEYFPIHELLQSPKHMVNRGVRGYKTGLLREHLDAHVFGTAVDQIQTYSSADKKQLFFRLLSLLLMTR